MPPLKRQDDTLASTTVEKAATLRERFYPQNQANLEDINENLAYEALVVNSETSFEEVSSALKSRKSYSAPGFDSLPYAFLKALGPSFVQILMEVINGC